MFIHTFAGSWGPDVNTLSGFFCKYVMNVRCQLEQNVFKFLWEGFIKVSTMSETFVQEENKEVEMRSSANVHYNLLSFNRVNKMKYTCDVCVFMYVKHAMCACLHWKANAAWLNLQQLNVSALFLKAEVSGHTQVHSWMSLGSNAVESNTTARSCSRSGGRWWCFEWLRLCTEGKWGQRI